MRNKVKFYFPQSDGTVIINKVLGNTIDKQFEEFKILAGEWQCFTVKNIKQENKFKKLAKWSILKKKSAADTGPTSGHLNDS